VKKRKERRHGRKEESRKRTGNLTEGARRNKREERKIQYREKGKYKDLRKERQEERT
jgi:hypothetical protein